MNRHEPRSHRRINAPLASHTAANNQLINISGLYQFTANGDLLPKFMENPSEFPLPSAHITSSTYLIDKNEQMQEMDTSEDDFDFILGTPSHSNVEHTTDQQENATSSDFDDTICMESPSFVPQDQKIEEEEEEEEEEDNEEEIDYSALIASLTLDNSQLNQWHANMSGEERDDTGMSDDNVSDIVSLFNGLGFGLVTPEQLHMLPPNVIALDSEALSCRGSFADHDSKDDNEEEYSDILQQTTTEKGTVKLEPSDFTGYREASSDEPDVESLKSFYQKIEKASQFDKPMFPFNTRQSLYCPKRRNAPRMDHTVESIFEKLSRIEKAIHEISEDSLHNLTLTNENGETVYDVASIEEEIQEVCSNISSFTSHTLY